MKILIVEDDNDLREITTRSLEKRTLRGVAGSRLHDGTPQDRGL